MQLVVGAAVLDGGRVLAARRRSADPESGPGGGGPGGWEFPGGKVEPGESPQDAVVREVAEELALAIRVTGWLPGTTPIGAGLRLSVALATPVGAVTDLAPGPDHDRLRWLGADELDAVDWLPADRPFLRFLATHLTAGPTEESAGRTDG